MAKEKDELCKKCLRFLFDLGRTRENDVPWIHCHHEESGGPQIVLCDICDDGGWKPQYWPLQRDSHIMAASRESDFCPKCGRKLGKT